ncbi:MAG: peptidyl-prolyl cis-trans isomerase [Candidatus Latescibacteria bacterium]|nr:peptidyl-prolyl cis-trans isomerase [bacterium]MBD3425148.1 peptidyl-prolyl cis-trans isomerase [Candidatus Latescibacterota bacterium]
MYRKVILSLLSLALLIPLFAGAVNAAGKDNPMVHVKTNKGDFTIELYPEKAPVTVENFIYYVKNKFYDETLIHRVRKNFVLQGGGYTVDNIKKETAKPIKNEADNGLKNDKYTISMARTNEINSATSQFFINLQNNPALDHKGTSPRQYGYAVFGKVVEGQGTIDKIGKVEAVMKDGMYRPVKKVVIESMRVVKKDKEKEKE